MTKEQKNEVIEALKEKFSQYNKLLCDQYGGPLG